LAGQAFVREAAEANVNQRYTIESISVGGVQVDRAHIPSHLRQRLRNLVGERCDMALIEDIAGEIRSELHLRAVTEHLSKGSQPDRIRVNFEVVKKALAFEVSVPKFLYHSSQGWTGEVDAGSRFRNNTLTLGVVGNGDDSTERFTGLSARLENSKFFSERVKVAVQFEGYHEQWNDSTRSAVAALPADHALELYRNRRNVAPEITVKVAKGLHISGGFSFQQMESASSAGADSFRSANAVTADLRFNRKLESDLGQQSFDAHYSLRAGWAAVGSDFSYTRQVLSGRYEIKIGRQTISDTFMAGTLTGSAPFYERFVLGSSSTLRGWNRYAINPLGGTRVSHNSVAYGRQVREGTVEAFYDTGALSSEGRSSQVRHSFGMGYRQGIFVLTVAMPVMEGHGVYGLRPVFTAGMNY
jgi:outer membrane protein assembly factor BamA